MTSTAFPELLESIAQMRVALQGRLAGIDRYRAIQAIEKTMAEFPDLDELTQSLSEIRERMQRQLHETREYRAMLSVERIMPELSAVLDVLSQTPDAHPATEAARPESEPVVAKEDAAEERAPAADSSGEPADAGHGDEAGPTWPGFAVAGDRRERADTFSGASDFAPASPSAAPPDETARVAAALSLSEFLGPTGPDGEVREEAAAPGGPPGGLRDETPDLPLRPAREGRAA